MDIRDALLPGSTNKAIDRHQQLLAQEQARLADLGAADARRVIRVDPAELDRYVTVLRAAAEVLESVARRQPNMFDSRIVSASGASGPAGRGYALVMDAAIGLGLAADRTLAVYWEFLAVEAATFDGSPGLSAMRWMGEIDSFYGDLERTPLVLRLGAVTSAVSLKQDFQRLSRNQRELVSEGLERLLKRYQALEPNQRPRFRTKTLTGIGIRKRYTNILVEELERARQPKPKRGPLGAARARAASPDRYYDALEKTIARIHEIEPAYARRMQQRLMSGQTLKTLGQMEEGKTRIGLSNRSRVNLVSTLRENPALQRVNRTLDALDSRLGRTTAQVTSRVPDRVTTTGRVFLRVGLPAVDVVTLGYGVRSFQTDNFWDRTSTVLLGTSLGSQASAWAFKGFVVTLPLAIPAHFVSLTTGVASVGASGVGRVANRREESAVEEFERVNREEIQERLQNAYEEAARAQLERQDRADIERYFEQVRSRPGDVLARRRRAAA